MAGLSFSKPRRRAGGGHFGRPLWRHLLDWGLVIVLFGACALMVARLDEVALQKKQGATRVVDGDTLTISGERVRLAGIDAFERGQECARGDSAYDCGAEAARAMSDMVRGGGVVCEGRTFDRYRRLLVTCRRDGADLNAAMVSAGWALAYGDYEAKQRAARAARRGAWEGTFDTPQDWRARTGGRQEDRHDLLRWVLDLLRQIVMGGKPGGT